MLIGPQMPGWGRGEPPPYESNRLSERKHTSVAINSNDEGSGTTAMPHGNPSPEAIASRPDPSRLARSMRLVWPPKPESVRYIFPSTARHYTYTNVVRKVGRVINDQALELVIRNH